MPELPTYVLERIFDAPRELVWKTWTDAELLARWYGPGAETVIHQLDLRSGGQLFLEMKWGETGHFQKADYTEVIPYERLVWFHSMTDKDGNPIPNPMMPDWPRVLLTTVVFDEKDGKTHMRLTWVPHQATDAEIACFKGAISGLDKGWGKGMEFLASLLDELQG